MRYKQEVEEKQHGWFWPVIIVISLILIYYLYSRHADKTAETGRVEVPETVLQVMPVTSQDVMLDKKYIGYITPINEVEVRPYISGFLDEISVSGGQDVKAGQPLLMIQQGEYKAQVDAAQAQILQTQADLANAKVYYERVKKVGPKAMSKTEFDNAKAKYLSAQAAVAQAQANYNLAKVNYDYTEINAPISGIVGEMSLTKGDYVSPAGQPMFSIIQYDPIRVVFSITDKDYLDELKTGAMFADDKIKLRLADGNIYNAAGTYQYSDNKVDRSTNSISVYADFPNPSKALVANAYVDVIVGKTYQNAVLVKKNLVSQEENGSYVYLINGSKLEKAKVNILGDKGDSYVLQNNFKTGDYLVLDKVSPQIASTKIKIKVVGKAGAGEKA